MIFMHTQQGQFLLVLDNDNLEELRSGRPAISPDKRVTVAFCPDLDWLGEQIKTSLEGTSIDVTKLDRLLKDGIDRKPVSVKDRATVDHLAKKRN